jgi:hypothetical protein
LSLKVTQVDSVPPLVRGGAAKNSEENAQILDLLQQKDKEGKPSSHYIEDITDDSAFTSLSQRIRSIGTKHGIKVSIRRDLTNNGMYFWAKETTEVPEVVETPEKTKTTKK